MNFGVNEYFKCAVFLLFGCFLSTFFDGCWVVGIRVSKFLELLGCTLLLVILSPEGFINVSRKVAKSRFYLICCF